MTQAEVVRTFPPLPTVADEARGLPRYSSVGEGTPLVLDNGSFYLSAGWAAGAAAEPQLRWRSVVGHRRADDGASRPVAGMEALLGGPAVIKARGLHQGGVCVTLEGLEDLLDATLSRLGVAGAGSRLPHPVLLTEAVCQPPGARGRIHELLFEAYGVPALQTGVDALWAAHANDLLAPGRGSFMCVGLGHQTSHILPLLQGRVQWAHVRRLPLGGWHASDLLLRLLQLRQPALAAQLSLHHVLHMKHDGCFVAPAHSYPTRQGQTVATPSVRYQLPPPPVTLVTPEEVKAREERREAQRKAAAARLTAMREAKKAKVVDDPELDLNLNQPPGSAIPSPAPTPVQPANASLPEASTPTQPLAQAAVAAVAAPVAALAVEEDSDVEVERAGDEAVWARQAADDEDEDFMDDEDDDEPEPGRGAASRAGRGIEDEAEHRMRRPRLSAGSATAKRIVAITRTYEKPAEEKHGHSHEKKRRRGASGAGSDSDSDFGADDADWDLYVTEEPGRTSSGGSGSGLGQVLPEAPATWAEWERAHQLVLEGLDRMRVAEVLFQPSLAGLHCAGLGELLQTAARALPPAAAAVFVTGGPAQWAGLASRCAAELQAAVRSRPGEDGPAVAIRSAAQPELDAWRGAARWAMQPAARACFVTRAAYDELGPYRCFRANALSPFANVAPPDGVLARLLA